MNLIVGLVLKKNEPSVLDCAHRMMLCLHKKDPATQYRIFLDLLENAKDFFDPILSYRAGVWERDVQHCHVWVVIGGDGTFLRLSPYAQHIKAPIVGIHMGKLGFLNDIPVSESVNAVESIFHWLKTAILLSPWAWNKMPMHKAVVLRKGEKILEQTFLNEVLVTRGHYGRMIGWDVHCGSSWLQSLRGDGCIVSSSLGSTAYSMAAGGPIIEPHAQVYSVTPMCAHVLNVRPVVVSSQHVVKLKISMIPTDDQDQPHAVLAVLDGHTQWDLKLEDVIEVSKVHHHTLQVVRREDQDYFYTLRTKLCYGQRLEV